MLRNNVKKIAISVSKMTGRYVDRDKSETETHQAEAVYFSGDIPSMAGGEFNQYRLVINQLYPLIEKAKNLVYTKKGMAWIRGALHRRYSFQEVGLSQILDKPETPRKEYANASVLQAQTPCTYGDWMSEHVASLARAKKADAIIEPLLIPRWWFEKPYVQRDLRSLGIRAEAVNAPVLIRNATVINKTRVGHYWTRDEAEAVVEMMSIKPQPAAKGTAIYLSRKGERGEGPKREINNDVTEAAMIASSVQVVRTKECTEEDYIGLAQSADTVFMDHGSAGYNMMFWKPSRVVEFFPPDYWDSAFLFLADSLGITDYHLWEISAKTTTQELVQRIRTVLGAPA